MTAEPHPLPYRTLPIPYWAAPDGQMAPVPFLLNQADLVRFLRLDASLIRFPEKTIRRYRKLGLRSVRIGRRVWFRLDDVLRFLDAQQERLNVTACS